MGLLSLTMNDMFLARLTEKVGRPCQMAVSSFGFDGLLHVHGIASCCEKHFQYTYVLSELELHENPCVEENVLDRLTDGLRPMLDAHTPECTDMGGFNTVLLQMCKLFPGLRKLTTHPIQGYQATVYSCIINTNDWHGWTREQIADWLETLDIDLTLVD